MVPHEAGTPPGGDGGSSAPPRRPSSGTQGSEAATRIALEIAHEVGFDLAGVAPLRPPAAAQRFREWLAAGRHAGMAWLERQRERILDPESQLRGGRSILVLGLSHARGAVRLAGGGRVARYAAGRDYHNRVRKLLRKLAGRLRAAGLGGRARSVVDSGPLFERSHAAEAGLGFESKAANLLHPRYGPWFFLGELLLDAELAPTPGPPPGSCGTCTACLDACPTGALVAPGVLDARLCISYHTIESRAPVPEPLRERLGGWAFGCDVCSEVCPWGLHPAPGEAAGLGTHGAVERLDLADWLATPAAAFEERFRASAFLRPGRAGLARNAALALAWAPSERGRDALLAALEDPAPLVREAAGWSLARAHGADAGARAALERALAREADPAARAGLAASLGRS